MNDFGLIENIVNCIIKVIFKRALELETAKNLRGVSRKDSIEGFLKCGKL